MAIAFESYASIEVVSTMPVTVAKPSGTVEDDWLIAAVSVRDMPTGLTAPAGWTLVVEELECDNNAGEHLISVWKKKAGASEPSSYEFSWDSSGKDAVATIARFSGGDPTDVVDVSGTTAAASQSVSGDIDCPSVTTTVASTLLLRIGSQNQGSNQVRTAPGSHTERWSLATAGSNTGAWQGMATASQASAGSSGVATWASAATRKGGGITIALAPASGGGAVTAAAAQHYYRMMAGV